MVQKVALLLVILSSVGCLQAKKVPIETIHYDATNTKGPRMLFVFLPGNGDPVTVFQKKGLIESVRERGLSADMIAVNAHIGYYLNWTVFTRLKEDVIEPAKAVGYDQIWLIGNSLGGYGSLSYGHEYPGDITGAVLLGPFLGEQEADEIEQAGGIGNWKSGEIQKNAEDECYKQLWLWKRDRLQREKFWLWVKDCERDEGCYPKIYLGYGRHDRYSYGQKCLASFMPPERVIVIEGGHDWPTWKKLWDMFLDKNIFGVGAPMRGMSHRSDAIDVQNQ